MTDRRLPNTASVAHVDVGDKLTAPAAERNADAITALLARLAPPQGTALELASGTGQHIIHFARAMPHLTWQPSEIAPDRLKSIAAYVAEVDTGTIKAPIALNATQTGWGTQHKADLIVLINLTHLISSPETQTILSEVTQALTPTGIFVLYGPFMRNGQLISEGDRNFHASLTGSDPAIGYKNDADITAWMEDAGLTLIETVEMPANNLALIATKR